MLNKKGKLLPLLLALSLLAGCAAGPESSPPPEPPPESVSQSSAESQPELPASPEPEPEPELPDSLAGADGYYTPGHRLTLYAMEPGTGVIRTVREEDFWSGREVESVSPSGNRVLLSSWDGAPSREVVALSVYDIEKNQLTNLERTIEDTYGSWKESHWFPVKWSNGYCFIDEDTILYQEVCDKETPGTNHLHLYDIGANGGVAARFLELESPLGEQEGQWSADCIWWAEESAVLGHLSQEQGNNWVAWDAGTGKILSRWPGKNGDIPIAATPYQIRDGVMYYTEDDWDRDTFQLMAYDIRQDKLTALASGPLVITGDPVPPGEEKGRGYFEDTWLDEIREDGSFIIRSVVEPYGYRAFEEFREAVWSPAAGETIQLGEIQKAPAFPVDAARGYTPVFTTAPDGTGLFLPLPQEMAARYQEGYGRPYPVATLSSGELLFLAKEPLAFLPQEDPEKPGELAGAEGSTGGHRLSLYRFSPESGQTTLVRYPGFWNGREVESVSPSGNRLLLATRDEGGQAALSVYNIRENLLTNLTYQKNFDGTKWEYQHWFPGKYRYRFVSEDAFLYEELTYSTTAKQYYLPRWCSTEYGLNGWYEWVVHPWLREHPNLPCIYLPEEQTILCDLPLEGGTQRFTWQVDVEARNNNGGRKNNLLSQTPAEDALPLEQYRPRPQDAPDFPLPKRMGPVWPLIALSSGETLFLAQ